MNKKEELKKPTGKKIISFICESALNDYEVKQKPCAIKG
jgi:hypothetical protein